MVWGLGPDNILVCPELCNPQTTFDSFASCFGRGVLGAAGGLRFCIASAGIMRYAGVCMYFLAASA